MAFPLRPLSGVPPPYDGGGLERRLPLGAERLDRRLQPRPVVGVGRPEVADGAGDDVVLEHLGLLADAVQELGPRPGAAILGELESAVGARAAGMDDALGNTLAIEARQLFDQVMILQQERARRSRALRTLIVGNRCPVFVGQNGLLGQFSLLDGRSISD